MSLLAQPLLIDVSLSFDISNFAISFHAFEDYAHSNDFYFHCISPLCLRLGVTHYFSIHLFTYSLKYVHIFLILIFIFVLFITFIIRLTDLIFFFLFAISHSIFMTAWNVRKYAKYIHSKCVCQILPLNLIIIIIILVPRQQQ